ncbi:MAG: glycosyltransferase family 2 protein [Desulfovibrionaceae bacterium]
MTAKTAISIVVPVYNEEDNLPRLLAEISAAAAPLGREWECLFIDDGSKDGSLDVIRSLAAETPQLKYLAFAENRGQSAAFSAGFRAARHPIIITMDADLQNDPADIPAMLERYEEGFELVIGWRAERKDTWVKRISSKIGNKVRRWFTRDTVHDTGCSLKVMDAEMLRMLPRFKNMHRFLPPLLAAQGARIAEVKVNHRQRHMGSSKYGTWDRLKAGVYDLIGVRWLLTRYITWQIKEKN